MPTPTVGYLCFLCDEKNEAVKLKSSLYNEAQHWKSMKHIGKADICFEEYDALKHVITPKTEQIKIVAKQLKAKPVYNTTDYSIIALEIRTANGYVVVADTPAEIKRLAEEYIIESVVLGNFDDQTESK